MLQLINKLSCQYKNSVFSYYIDTNQIEIFMCNEIRL